MKYVLFFICFICFSCKKENPKIIISEKNNKPLINNVNDDGIIFLKKIYKIYIDSVEYSQDKYAIGKLKSKYFTKKLQQKFNAEDLDYDPIIQGQDIVPNLFSSLNFKKYNNSPFNYNLSST